MAEIPVEKKSNSWIWWLLLLLGIIALIWWLVSEADEEEVEPIDTDVVATDTVDVDEGPLGMAALGTLGTRIGEEIQLDGVEVNRLVGDMGFTIGEGAEETLVRFDQVPTPDTPTEGRIDVNPGSTVSLTGDVRSLDLSEMPEGVREDLEGTNEAYIYASRVSVADGGVVS